MKKLLLIISIFIAALLSACNGGTSGSTTSLQSITIPNSYNTTVLGVTQNFIATANYSDGSNPIVTNKVT